MKNIFSVVLTLSVLSLAGCKDDDNKSTMNDETKNRIYVNAVSDNTYTFEITHTPIVSTGNVEVVYPAKSTRGVEKDIVVNFEVDNSLISAYNELNQRELKEVPKEAITFEKQQVRFTKGNLASDDSMKLVITDISLLKEAEYLLPIKIGEISDPNGCRASHNLNVVYVIITTKTINTNVRVGYKATTGVVMDRNGWGYTVTPAPTNLNVSEMFNGNYGDNGWSLTGPAVVVIDMLTVKDFVSCKFSPYRNSWQNYCTKMNFYTSEDNVKWVNQGGEPFTMPSTLWDGSAETQYVTLYAPVKARFLKLEMLSMYSSTMGMNEFNAYTPSK